MIRRILENMAKFRDMQRFTAMVKDDNDKEKSDNDAVGFAEGEDWMLKINREMAQLSYQTAYGVTANKAQEVYEDVISKKYRYVNVMTSPIDDKRLWVGSRGRDILTRGGMFKEYASYNKDFMHLILAFIGGAIGGIGLGVAIIAL